MLRPYRQPVLDILHAGGRPSRVLDRELLVPITDFAFKQDFIVSNSNAYVPGFDLGMPFQCCLDLLLDVLGLRMGSISMLLTTLRTPDRPRISRSALLF